MGVGRCLYRDICFPGSSNGLDDAATAASKPARQRLQLPSIQKMLGAANLLRDTVEAVLEDPIENSDGRRVYARVIVRSTERGYIAATTGNQGSNLLSSMLKSNGLAICPETQRFLQVGEKVRVHITDWDRIEQAPAR